MVSIAHFKAKENNETQLAKSTRKGWCTFHWNLLMAPSGLPTYYTSIVFIIQI